MGNSLSSVLMVSIMTCVFAGDAAAVVSGFGRAVEPPPPPNTISGVVRTARAGDYAMIRGHIGRRLSERRYEFTDDAGTQAVLEFAEDNLQEIPAEGEPCFAWIRMVRPGSNVFSVEMISRPRRRHAAESLRDQADFYPGAEDVPGPVGKSQARPGRRDADGG